MDLRFLNKWGTALLVNSWLLFATGCSDAVKLVRETDTGGIVTYSYKADRGGPIASPHRKDALNLIGKKCPDIDCARQRSDG